MLSQGIRDFNRQNDRGSGLRRILWILLCFLFPFVLEFGLQAMGPLLLSLYPENARHRIESSIFYQLQFHPEEGENQSIRLIYIPAAADWLKQKITPSQPD